MASVWKKIDNYDQSVDVFMSIQNNSLVPFSKVTIQFTTASAPEEGKGFVLTGPNQWSQRVPANTNVFYKEEDGGIITWWSREIEKLVNYDIPTQEETVTSLTAKSVICPEGSFITIQNTGKSPIYYNMLGKANFVLTEHQAVSYTFAKDNVINLKSDGTGTVTYMIGQSPNVTMLSEETQRKLDEIIAKVDGLIENAATKEELDVVKRRTYFGQWSPFLNSSGNNGKQINTPIFIKDKLYHSEFLQDNNILDLSLLISYRRTDELTGLPVDENGVMQITLITQSEGDDLQVANFYCDNQWLKQNITGVELYRDNTNGQVKINLNFKSTLTSYTALISCRADNVKFVESDGSLGFLNEKINIFVLDKDNDGIHFTDETFYLGMLKSWDFSLSVSKETFNSITKLDKDNVEGKNKQTITSGNELSVVYSENIDSSDAILSVGVPAMIGANKVVGLNIKPKPEVKSNGIFLDLIVMSNGQQTKSTQDDKFVFTIPLWKHTNFAYLYISEELRKITAENAKDFFVEIVYS